MVTHRLCLYRCLFFLLYDVDDCYSLVAYKIIVVPIVLGYDQMRLL